MVRFLAVFIVLFATSIGLADLPSFAIKTTTGQFKVYSPTSNENIGSVSDALLDACVRVQGNEAQMVLWPKTTISKVYFPWEVKKTFLSADKNDEILHPFWFGSKEKSSTQTEWGWGSSPSLKYPGQLFAPIAVTSGDNKASLLAATNWPPKRVAVLKSLGRTILMYDIPEIPLPGEYADYKYMRVTTDGTWHSAVEVYRKWVTRNMSLEGLQDDYPMWMIKANGFRSVGLMNMTEFKVQAMQNRVNDFGDVLPWIQMWGQMSNYVGPPDLAVPQLEPDEGKGCCLVEKNLHKRYTAELGEDLVAWIKGYKNNSKRRIGFYSRPFPEKKVTDPFYASWLRGWQRQNKRMYGANAYYVDVIGAKDFGNALSVARFVDSLPKNTFIESAVDIYPKAGLMSGAVQNAGYPAFGRFLMDRRIFFFGESNGEYSRWGDANQNRSERTAFLLGCKLETYNPSSMVRPIVALWDSVDFWESRPAYRDTKGLTVSDPDVKATWFEDKNGRSIVAIDNWSQKSKATVTLKGITQPVPTDKLSFVVYP